MISDMAENTKNKIDKLQKEIECKQIELKKLKKQYFLEFLEEFLNISEKEWKTIKKIRIEFPDRSNRKWQIKYIHHTKYYDVNNYANDPDSEIETLGTSNRRTKLSFGDNYNQYFIKGGCEKLFIYSSSDGTINIYNKDYDIELDKEEQYKLISKYAYNYNIPEWLIARFFIKIHNLKWTEEKIDELFNKKYLNT